MRTNPNMDNCAVRPTNYTSSLSLVVPPGGSNPRTNTSPNRTMTNGSIMNNSGNINRYNSQSNDTGEINGNLNQIVQNHKQAIEISENGEKFEVPLPFGYHLDLDFLRVCSDELVSGETLHKLKELKKARRKQRKTLEALMGIKQEQKHQENKKMVRDIESKTLSPPRTLNIPDLGCQDQPDIVNSSELVREALRESMISFQETLEQYKEGSPGPPILSDFDLISSHRGSNFTSTPRDKPDKFSTFPRHAGSPTFEGNLGMNKMNRQLSNSSISSVSTSSSALPYSVVPLSPEAYLASLPSSIPQGDQNEMETESIGSINSEMSTNTLRNIREQMARSLIKLKDYEKQVEAIPVLQVKLSVLKEEKRLLMLKLKARESKMRRERGESCESDGVFDEDMETDDEDLDTRVQKMSNSLKRNGDNRRARSESPFTKLGTVHPEDFISYQHRKRSTSCGFNSDSSDISPTGGGRKYYSQDSPEFAARRAMFSRNKKEPVQNIPEIETTDQAVNTDPVEQPKPVIITPPPKVITREKGANTDPPPKSPPPPRKVHHGTNTMRVRSIPKGIGTDMKMADLISRDEVETRVQDAIFRTEEEIMSCPLLQKAMQKVEEEALRGPEPEKEYSEAGCQVGQENLRPFVIDIGVACHLDKDESENKKRNFVDSWCQVTPITAKTVDVSCGLSDVERLGLMKTVGVGECKVIEEPSDPTKLRTVGVCTEKWIEVIRASKQTDTEDFAFKDTESPRVVDMPLEPVLERPERRSQRLSSLTSPCLRKSVSPSVSRRSSTNSPSVSRKSSDLNMQAKSETKNKGTMTEGEMKMKMDTVDTGVGSPVTQTKTVGISALLPLPLVKHNLPPGSPISTPDTDNPPVNLNLCDKCDKDIHSVASDIISGPPLSPVIAPPSPDQPWVSKIPRPCPVENPEIARLKSASSSDNLSGLRQHKVHSQVMQRSKSNLEPASYSRLGLPVSSKTPPPVRRDMGTPPPHPKSPAPGSKRAPSPLARSPGPSNMSASFTAGTTGSKDKNKSFIPKLSPSSQKKDNSSIPEIADAKQSSKKPESKSFIPRVATPPGLRKMFPKTSDNKSERKAGENSDRNVVRKQTPSRGQAGVSNPDLDMIGQDSKSDTINQQGKNKLADIKEKISIDELDSGDETETIDDDSKGTQRASTAYPLPGAALFTPITDNRKKTEPSKEMKSALKVLNDSISRGVSRSNAQVTNAVNIIQQEWFKISSTKQSNPLNVDDYLDCVEDISKDLLDQVVNMADVNGNTALHYSVSHGNFDVVSILLDSKVANANILNKAGYTCSMLISLAVIANETHRAVVKKLFSISDLNLRASQHGQTALMLAVSHGRLDMVELLTEAGADVNIRDEDGSTALMCAAEHGHIEIVKLLIHQQDINVGATDNDGLSALSVAMEAGHRDIGVLLYANMSFSRGTSPHSSMRMKKTSSRNSIVATPTGGGPADYQSPGLTGSPVPPTPPHRSRRNSSNT